MHLTYPMEKHHAGNIPCIICKHNARWLHASQLKASPILSLQKTYNENKNDELKPGKGDGI
jgi:hypothetical protein